MKFSRLVSCAAAFVVSIAFSTPAHAALRVPYGSDAQTLHLWHLDETEGDSAADSASGVAGPITLQNIGVPSPGTGPYTNTTLGAEAFAGLGKAVSGSTKQHLLYGGAFGDVSEFANPETGAFTFEALAKFDIDPTGAIDAEIVSGDNGLGLGNRGWQWRIFNGDMEWDVLAGATDNDFKAKLPVTGPNAAIAGAWYHLAVTYSGFNPTNGEAANLITFYWTLLDGNRTNADVLGQFTATRPLDGSPIGASQPSLGIAGSARNTTGNPGNNEGLIGSIDEVRISSVARTAGEMAFTTGGQGNPPTFTRQPAAATLTGYGKPLILAGLISGTPPLTYTWRQNGTIVPGQSESTLVISNAVFANSGAYQLIVSNAFGMATSAVAQVTIGAAPTGLFNTGLDTNGVLSAGDIPDPHWTLLRSSDPAYLGPDAPIFEYSFPIQFADPNGSFSPTNSSSMWIGLGGNAGGTTETSPAGQYVYRTTFLLDTADPATVSMQGTLWASGSISDIILNGKSTGISLNPGGTLYVTSFSITNGFVAGLNTLDFVQNLAAAGISGIRVQLDAVGQALAPGVPVIVSQPADATVRDSAVQAGSRAEFSAVALGRAPLRYQWLANGAVLAGATNRVLSFANPAAGAQGTNFALVVSNDSGSVTSRVAVLKISATNQPPVAATLSYTTLPDQPLTISLSDFIQRSSDPDRDVITFISADAASTNGATVEQVDGNLVYTPNAGYTGPDQLHYVISDPFEQSQGVVNIRVGAAAPSAITATLAGNTLTLNWTGAFDLEAAAAVTGPWTKIATGATAPYTVNLSTAGQTQQFYRLAAP